eukprot:scaffold40182_cov36-Tisochrysis_lutea.AAC.5
MPQTPEAEAYAANAQAVAAAAAAANPTAAALAGLRCVALPQQQLWLNTGALPLLWAHRIAVHADFCTCLDVISHSKGPG